MPRVQSCGWPAIASSTKSLSSVWQDKLALSCSTSTIPASLYAVCGMKQAASPSPLHANLAEGCGVGSIGINLVIRHHHADHLHVQGRVGSFASKVPSFQ